MYCLKGRDIENTKAYHVFNCIVHSVLNNTVNELHLVQTTLHSESKRNLTACLEKNQLHVLEIYAQNNLQYRSEKYLSSSSNIQKFTYSTLRPKRRLEQWVELTCPWWWSISTTLIVTNRGFYIGKHKSGCFNNNVCKTSKKCPNWLWWRSVVNK